MMSNFLIIISIWLIVSFLLNYFLKRKFELFKKFGKPLFLFIFSCLLFGVHKITAFVLQAEEIIFFYLSFLFFGIFLISLVMNREELSLKKSEKERSEINKIAAQSQLFRIEQNRKNNVY